MRRDEAWELLCEHTKSDSLRKHALAVEAAMRYFAAKFEEDEEVWGVTGLLHDFDYERDPQGHPQNGKPILEQAGVPGAIVHAIQSHGDHTGIPRVTAMEKSLYAVDELTGFVTAVALVRPSKAVRDVDAPADQTRALVESMRLTFRSRLNVTTGHPLLTEFSHPMVHKGSALLWLCDYYGVAIEDSERFHLLGL